MYPKKMYPIYTKYVYNGSYIAAIRQIVLAGRFDKRVVHKVIYYVEYPCNPNGKIICIIMSVTDHDGITITYEQPVLQGADINKMVKGIYKELKKMRLMQQQINATADYTQPTPFWDFLVYILLKILG